MKSRVDADNNRFLLRQLTAHTIETFIVIVVFCTTTTKQFNLNLCLLLRPILILCAGSLDIVSHNGVESSIRQVFRQFAAKHWVERPKPNSIIL